MKEKILIENGTIIDGTGSKEYIGNIVIEDNKKLVKLFSNPDQIFFVSVALEQQEDSGAR